MTLFEEALMMLDEVKRRVEALAVTDAAIVELVEEAVKRIEADYAALAFDAVERDRANRELERAVVRATTVREQERIAATQPEVRWQEHNNNALGW